MTDDAQVGGWASLGDQPWKTSPAGPALRYWSRSCSAISREPATRPGQGRAAAAEIGYRPDSRAQLLSRKQTWLIGVSFGVGHEFHADLLTKLYAAAQDSGYELVLSGVTQIVGSSAPRRIYWRSGVTR